MASPSSAGDTPLRVSFPRVVWAALAVVGLLQVGGILTQLAVVEDQRKTNRTQRALIERQVEETLPLVEDTKPLVDEALRSLPEAGRLGKEVGSLTETATPLLKDLRSAGAVRSTRLAGDLASTLLSSDIGGATKAGAVLAISLLNAGAPDALRATSVAMGELLERDRLRRLLVGSIDLMEDVRVHDLVARAARASRTIPKQYELQRRTYELQARQLELAEQLLAIARETERHAESLDRKTGGPAD